MMTEEDLAAIEALMKQKVHVLFPQEEWSRAVLKAMLSKIPELVAEVRAGLKDREVVTQMKGLL